MEFPAKGLEALVDELSKLPGIGKKTAARLALHILKRPTEDNLRLGNAISLLSQNVRRCSLCNNISDGEICSLCANPNRDKSIICVVEEINDVLAIEKTSHYQGLYHVLGGVIHPSAGIGPSHLTIDRLLQRAADPMTQEIILALNATMEGDTTAFFIAKKLQQFPIVISGIARGLPVGGELEYSDELTLSRSLKARTPYFITPNSNS